MQNVILYAITVLIWGSTWYAITFQLGTVDPIVSLAYRFALAAIALMTFLKITNRLNITQFTRSEHTFIALQGILLFSLNYWLFYMGTGFVTSGLISVLFSTISLMNVLNQRLFFKIAIRRQVVLGSLIGLTGIGAIFWPEITNHDMTNEIVTGIGLCIIASYTASLGNMASLRNNRSNIPVLEGNAFGMAYGAIFSIIIAFIKGAEFTFEPTVEYTLSLIYLALFGSAIAFGCYLTLLKNIGADKAAYAAVLFPIIALAISTIFEGYTWTPQAAIGLILVVIGNIVAMVKRERLLHWRRKKSREIL